MGFSGTTNICFAVSMLVDHVAHLPYEQMTGRLDLYARSFANAIRDDFQQHIISDPSLGQN